MKTHLFFFSATGNSLMVAKDLAAKLPGTQIFSIPKVMNQPIDLDADNIGIVFPEYYGGIPRIVRSFINKLEPGKAKYIFAICTCGSLPLGTLPLVQKQMTARGLVLNAGFSVPMPGNYLVKYGAFSAEKQKSMFIKEQKKMAAIAAVINNRDAWKIERNNRVINGIGNIIYKVMYPKFPSLDQNFTVNEKCNGCNRCEKVCPAQNIKIVDGRPAWQGNCEHCLACIQWCPVEAIQYGSQTNDRQRYHHPEVRVNELYRED